MGEGIADEAAISELASGLREHELDIGWALETILRSELFFSEQNIASRVSSPVEFVMSTVRSLELFEKPPSTLILAEWCTRLGQDLFRPPNVGGWNGGRSWLTSRTIVGRSNFAAALVAGDLRAPSNPPPLEPLVERHRVNCFFERLLLSSSLNEKATSLGVRDYGERVAKLLSSPEAYLT